MRKAIMDLYRDAQFGHRVVTDDSPLMRSARFIGRTAGFIHRIFTRTWFRIILAAAVLWLILRWAGISINILHDAELLFTIK